MTACKLPWELLYLSFFQQKVPRNVGFRKTLIWSFLRSSLEIFDLAGGLRFSEKCTQMWVPLFGIFFKQPISPLFSLFYASFYDSLMHLLSHLFFLFPLTLLQGRKFNKGIKGKREKNTTQPEEKKRGEENKTAKFLHIFHFYAEERRGFF